MFTLCDFFLPFFVSLNFVSKCRDETKERRTGYVVQKPQLNLSESTARRVSLSSSEGAKTTSNLDAVRFGEIKAGVKRQHS
jgi:hypothetical protein